MPAIDQMKVQAFGKQDTMKHPMLLEKVLWNQKSDDSGCHGQRHYDHH